MSGTSKKVRFKTKPPGQMALEGMDLVETPARKIPAEDKDWEQFWNAYPRKVDKYQARQAWDKLMKDPKVKPDEILKGLRAQIPVLAQNGPFVPHPGTWLRHRRWLDDVGHISPHQPTQAERLYTAALDRYLKEGKV